MKIYLAEQKNKFKQHLDYLKTQRVMQYELSRLKQKTTSTTIGTNKKIDQLNLDFLLDYHIFPKNIMTFKTQWADEHREMKKGDTIVQQLYFPPTKPFSQKIIFGVRICDVIDESDRKGFSYETLEGHVEKGISTFMLKQTSDGLVFEIQTYSTPGNVLTKLLGPVFSVPYQTYCTAQALKNVKRQLEKQ